MNIEKRIRAIAAKKIKVRITGKTRSKGGFYVWYHWLDEMSEHHHGSGVAKTKREALQVLLSKLRCMDEMEFSITVRPPHVGDKP